MQIVDGTPYIEQVKRLLFEYTNALGRDLAFQHLEEELLDPTSKYTPRRENCWSPAKRIRFGAWLLIIGIPSDDAK